MKVSQFALSILLLTAIAPLPKLVMAQEQLEISGGTTPQKDVLEPKHDALLKATGVDIKVNGVGTGNGMLALLEGKVTVATVGDTLADSIEAARKAAKASNREIKIPVIWCLL